MAGSSTMRSGISPDRLVWLLTAIVSVGVTAVLPVLPLYANQQGADARFLGWMMAGYWAANLVALPAGGWLSDRFGRRPVLFLGLLAYGLASVGFLVVHGLGAFVVLRAIEGVAAACVIPAAMAYAADRAPADQQGKSMAALAAAEHVGILIGPMIGGALAAQLGLGSPFIALGLLCFAGLVLVARMPESLRPLANEPSEARIPFTWDAIRWPLAWGLGIRSWASGFSIGLYEVVWPLFMLSLGASVWQITLSWTVFAIPSILLSPVTGRLIDRFGGGRLAVWGAGMSAALTLFYASAQDPWFMILLSLIEGIGVAVAYPGQNALLVQVAPERQRGRMIGGISTLRTIGAMVAALLTPGLYAADPAACFGVTSVILVLGVIGLGVALPADARRQHRRAAQRLHPDQSPLAAAADGA